LKDLNLCDKKIFTLRKDLFFARTAIKDLQNRFLAFWPRFTLKTLFFSPCS